MPLISPSVDTLITTSLIILPPSWYLLHRRHRPKTRPRGTQPTTQNASASPNLRPPYERILTFVVHLHTLYILYLVIVHWPPNLFSRLGLPLTTSSDRIRSILLERAGLKGLNETLPKPLEDLLTKLGNAEVRVAYVKYGQTVIQDCVHCKTSDQYALFAIPGPLLQYIREGIFVGFLTVEYSGRSRWRTLGLVVVVAAFLAEAYTVLSVPVTIPRDGKAVTMWHDTLYLLRHLLFLLLPIVISLLPTSPIPVPLTPILLHTKAVVDTLSKRLTLLKFLEPAIMRDEKLREASNNAWNKQKMGGKWVREDRGVWNVASQFVVNGAAPREATPSGKESEELLKGKIRETVNELMKAASERSVPPPPMQ